VALKEGVSSVEHMPWIHINQSNNVTGGTVTGSEVSHAITDMGDWTLSAEGLYIWHWNESLNKGVQFQGIQQSLEKGLLRVETRPAVPTRIYLDGIQRNDWGLNWVKMPVGSYMLSFSDVYYYNIPATVTINYYPGSIGNVQSLNAPINIYPDTVTEVIVNFEQLGDLRVETYNTDGLPATIYCNGVPMDDWGFWCNIEPGEYTISFESLSGKLTPPPITVTVNAGAGTHVIGDYSNGTSQVVP
jgi:hypothetical protein